MLARRGMTATTRTGREGQRRVARAGLCRGRLTLERRKSKGGWGEGIGALDEIAGKIRELRALACCFDEG